MGVLLKPLTRGDLHFPIGTGPLGEQLLVVLPPQRQILQQILHVQWQRGSRHLQQAVVWKIALDAARGVEGVVLVARLSVRGESDTAKRADGKIGESFCWLLAAKKNAQLPCHSHPHHLVELKPIDKYHRHVELQVGEHLLCEPSRQVPGRLEQQCSAVIGGLQAVLRHPYVAGVTVVVLLALGAVHLERDAQFAEELTDLAVGGPCFPTLQMIIEMIIRAEAKVDVLRRIDSESPGGGMAVHRDGALLPLPVPKLLETCSPHLRGNIILAPDHIHDRIVL
mmetsp:Transcript_116071/g.266381  ORF Transcript_116071/g.266381 Transcript_116071/m.266381 type:complete len:281 (-) Transcript_116071:365-1207(-)